MLTTYSFECTTGNPVRFSVLLLADDGSPADLSRAKAVTWQLTDSNGNTVLSLPLTVLNARGGTVEVDLTAEQTTALVVSCYSHQITVDGTPFLQGTVQVNGPAGQEHWTTQWK